MENSRLAYAALLFLIGEVDPHVGLLTTPDTLADLLVNDITAGSSRLRQEIPRLLNKMLDEGIVMQDGDEYRIQTREGAEWDRDYRTRLLPYEVMMFELVPSESVGYEKPFRVCSRRA